MRRIWTIAWKDIYSTFSDRNLVLTMIVTPLAIATIVGLAFGKLSNGDVSIRHIPVAIVNLDKGINSQNFGRMFTQAFVPSTSGGSAVTVQQQDGAGDGC